MKSLIVYVYVNGELKDKEEKMSSMYGVSNWPTKNAALKIWVIEMAEMCQPDTIV